ASQYDEGATRYKYFELPAAFYTATQFDRIELGGKLVGLANLSIYTANLRSAISLGSVDRDVPAGTEIELVWGEPDGGSPNPAVERHSQLRVRGTVIDRPFTEGTEGSNIIV